MARRFTLDLHNMLGFWMFVLIFVWALGGIYFAFPNAFNTLAEALQEGQEETAASLLVQDGLAVLRAATLRASVWSQHQDPVGDSRVRYPLSCSITGLMMWWWRVIRRPRITR